jgi:N-acetylglucosaminyl-diphospho-decaprenol L-rhamnosyltransferase
VSVDVTAVIVTHNSASMITGLLASVPAALGELRAEVVVVDNGSTDSTVAVAQSRGIHIVEAENLGYSAGINRGVREASGTSSAILVLNPDVRLEPRSVERLHARLLKPKVGIVAPRIRDDEGHLQRSLRRVPSLGRALGLSGTRSPRWSEYVHEESAYMVAHEVDWALGAILLVSRACYDAVGGWDESFFLYSEETEFCLRAADHGFTTWFEPTATAIHVGAQSGQSNATHAMQIINRVRLYARRNGSWRATAYYGLTILSELSWIARGSRKSRFALQALIRPSRRPPELNAGSQFVPRD